MSPGSLEASRSRWHYVNGRRLFTMLMQSIDKSAQWVVFEPNVSDAAIT